MAKTQDLATAIGEAQDWLSEISGELNDAIREYDRYKESDDIDIDEVKSAMETIVDCVDRALSRLE